MTKDYVQLVSKLPKMFVLTLPPFYSILTNFPRIRAQNCDVTLAIDCTAVRCI